MIPPTTKMAANIVSMNKVLVELPLPSKVELLLSCCFSEEAMVDIFFSLYTTFINVVFFCTIFTDNQHFVNSSLRTAL
jgi:hypothetical protein